MQAEARARRQGEDLPAVGLFDSNCITPGTEFMHRLDKHLKFFVRRKLATDPSWAHIKVLYSGYDVPGEGEHKIMEFIRYEVRSSQHIACSKHVSGYCIILLVYQAERNAAETQPSEHALETAASNVFRTRFVICTLECTLCMLVTHIVVHGVAEGEGDGARPKHSALHVWAGCGPHPAVLGNTRASLLSSARNNFVQQQSKRPALKRGA